MNDTFSSSCRSQQVEPQQRADVSSRVITSSPQSFSLTSVLVREAAEFHLLLDLFDGRSVFVLRSAVPMLRGFLPGAGLLMVALSLPRHPGDLVLHCESSLKHKHL